jgi:hypothetical protein
MSNSISSAPYVAQVDLDNVVVQVHVDDAKRDAKRYTQLLNLRDRFAEALLQRKAQGVAVGRTLRELRGLRTEAAEWEAANPPLQRRRATRCGLATSLAGLAVIASGGVTGILLNNGIFVLPSMLTGGIVLFLGQLTYRDADHNPVAARVDSKQQAVGRQQDILAQADKALVRSHTNLTRSMCLFMTEQVTHHTALTSAEARIVAEYVWTNVYLDDESVSILGLDRAAQRQGLLDKVPVSYSNFSLLSKTRDALRSKALAMKHPSDEVEAWLAKEETTIDLLRKGKQLAAAEWTESLACYCASHFGSRDEIPKKLHSNPRVQAAMNARAESLRHPCKDSDAGPRAGEGQSSS